MSSAPNSKLSGTAASGRPSTSGQRLERAVVNACNAAADELLETRRLTEILERENAALRSRLETEQRLTGALEKLTEARSSEATSLRSALAAKDETISAKNALIENRDKTIATLKAKPRSPLKRLGDILLGAALFAVFK